MSKFSNITELTPWEKERLVRGKQYRVCREFRDFTGKLHKVGEEWIFAASIFSPYDELLCIGVKNSDGVESKIELDLNSVDQADVIHHFEKYVVPAV